MSRLLYSGENQVVQTYDQHCAKCNAGNGWARGIDIVKQKNQIDSITAHSDGTVIKVMTGQVNMKNDAEGFGYGNYVVIWHTGNYATLYGHLDTVSVKQGQTVKAGQILGKMGNTGTSYGAHLHFELRKYTKKPASSKASDIQNTNNFKWLDPTPYIDQSIPGVISSNTPDGYLDSASVNNNQLAVSGWAYLNGGSQTVTIKVYQGTTLYKTYTVKASNSRPDVQKAKGYPANVGFSAKFDASKYPTGTYQVKAYIGVFQLTNVKEIKVVNTAYVAGNKYTLNNTPVYSSETGVSIGTRSGVYYIWSNTITNNRIRMTASFDKVGVAGQVSFFVNINDLK